MPIGDTTSTPMYTHKWSAVMTCIASTAMVPKAPDLVSARMGCRRLVDKEASQQSARRI
jgi:hypothetical protein